MRYLILLVMLGIGTVNARQKDKNHILSSPQKFSIIPSPVSIIKTQGDFYLSPKVIIHFNDDKARATATLLNEFLYSNYGFRLKLSASDRFSGNGTINIMHDDKMPAENYTLKISPRKITLKGDAAGTFYALQTLQQLFPLQKTSRTVLPGVNIFDKPRFKYRGLMLDVSRHFFPVNYIKKFIDVMGQYKLNNFHWHLTDDQGWRIEIKKYPELQNVAAWREVTEMEKGSLEIKNGRYGGYYTQEQVKEIVRYATERHINIVPEIEMPGHSSAALAAYPNLGCTGGPYHVLTSGGVIKDVFCAGNDSVFTFLQGVIDEVVTLFPGKYIHIGGDETPKDRWKVCPKCQARIKDLGLKDEHELQSYFVQRMEKYINQKGRKIIGWDEILEGGLAPNATVMSWRGEAGGIEAARQKHEVIMSPYTYVYLDYYQGKPATEPPAIGGFLPLASVYRYEPLSALLTKEEGQYIKGVQANTWAEYIASEKHMDYMVYPRALALAEIGWSPASQKDFANFYNRLSYRLNKLEQQKVNFRIPEPFGLKDSVTTAATINISLQPGVAGSSIYYTTDGTTPTAISQKANGMLKLSLTDNVPVILQVLTILPSGRQSAVYSAAYIKKPFHAAITPIAAPKEGLLFKTIYQPVKAAKALNIEKADTTGTVKDFSLSPFGQKSVFATTYEGYFLAGADGMYNFKINSDDGAVLYIDDEVVADNDGTHPATEKSGAIPLLKGFHQIKLKYFDGGGGKTLSVSASRNGLVYDMNYKFFH